MAINIKVIIKILNALIFSLDLLITNQFYKYDIC